ncbi:MAG: aromatic amino acid lyase [Flavobacteriales bacterium]|nr:aromatic amino acid lyase [Flavobacteriales bacterium]
MVMGGRRMTALAAALKKLGWAPLELSGPKEGTRAAQRHAVREHFAALLTVKSMRLAHRRHDAQRSRLMQPDSRTEPFPSERTTPCAIPVESASGRARTPNCSPAARSLCASRTCRMRIRSAASRRCMAPSRDAIACNGHGGATQLESVTDNPTVFDDDDLINPRRQFRPDNRWRSRSIASHRDGRARQHRRATHLQTHQRSARPAAFPGSEGRVEPRLHDPQYTAASLVSANKQCMPNSVDTIDSTDGQEDHVSMGAAASHQDLGCRA